jgi:transcriptional regulator with XRE-family HTH domain
MLEARPPSVAPDGPPSAPAPPPEPERPDQLAAEVARSVRDLRAHAGLSERAAARLLGTSQTQLRRMEDPRYLPSLRSLARLAAAYGHRLRIAFEPKDRTAKVPPKPPAPRPRAPARPKRPTPTRSARAAGRGGRRS